MPVVTVALEPLREDGPVALPEATDLVAYEEYKPAGTVISELKKAYFYKEKLLRAGAVVVADSLPEAKPEEATLPQADLSELQKESQEEE